MTRLLFIAGGGAIGALLRYLVSGLTYRFASPDFPWGTLVVNLVGCFLIGVLSELANALVVSQNFRSFILIGGLGAFTTFSTFGLESLNLLRDGEIKLALLNIVLSNVLGLLLVFAGFVWSRWLFGFFR